MNSKEFNEYCPEFYIDTIKREKKYNMESHFHEALEIFYLIDGERRYFINDTIYKVSSGNLVLVDINEIHKTADTDVFAHKRLVLNFNPSFIYEICPKSSGLDLCSCFKSNRKILPLSLKYKKDMEHIFHRMMEIYDSESETKRFHLQILLCELLLLINNHLNELKTKDKNLVYSINPKISKIIKYINSYYYEDITLSSAGKKLHISPFYLSKLFKENTSLTFVEYLNSVRIRKAKELLIDTDYRVIDITEKVGFNNHTHFTRTFKALTGVSPLQYRKLMIRE
ncbi:MAG: AraC family transcriptional regulator [Bacillota bacterium]